MNTAVKTLPPIPDKRYFSIGETSLLCAVKPHVLRYWEQEFSQLKPSTRTGGRRYYQQKDILIVRKIRELLYEKGFTIAGAKRQLQIFKPTEQPQVASIPDEKHASPIIELIQELELILEQITV